MALIVCLVPIYTAKCYAGEASVSSVIYTASVPTINLTASQVYYEPAVAGYMVLYAAGAVSNIPGRSYAVKISSLANQMGTTSSGASLNGFTNGINTNLSTQLYYTVYGNSITQQGFNQKVYISLTNGRIPVLYAKSSYLGYYNGYASNQFVVVQSIDTGSNEVVLYDPSVSHGGIHTVSCSSAFNSIRAVSGMALIYNY